MEWNAPTVRLAHCCSQSVHFLYLKEVLILTPEKPCSTQGSGILRSLTLRDLACHVGAWLYNGMLDSLLTLFRDVILCDRLRQLKICVLCVSWMRLGFLGVRAGGLPQG